MVGRRFRDPDIEFLGLAYLGGLFVLTDRVEEGLVLSDEALAALCAGELTELATAATRASPRSSWAASRLRP